ncbi:hypothetical protein AVEN_67901-1 [Araneus ventricosus]|uniref:Uncharacterized protein n=1 Tax=Araneus ventricosus TaxID=182803 RepID=A0A4Y2F002_ARAVE|nr:hypothetical protein AVEN_67901-1 [Araneus ventricosus]
MLETNLRTLESLRRSKEKFADFLEALVESCLLDSVLRVWERSRISIDADDSPFQKSLEKLMPFLLHEVLSEGFVKNSEMFKRNN